MARPALGGANPQIGGEGHHPRPRIAMYALDTHTVLDYFKGKGEVAKNLLAVPPREVALPGIVAYEVWIGVLGSVYPLTRVGPPPSGFVNSRSAPNCTGTSHSGTIPVCKSFQAL